MRVMFCSVTVYVPPECALGLTMDLNTSGPITPPNSLLLYPVRLAWRGGAWIIEPGLGQVNNSIRVVGVALPRPPPPHISCYLLGSQMEDLRNILDLKATPFEIPLS